MRQSTRDMRKRKPTTSTGAVSATRPKPDLLNLDGSFLLRCSNGKDLEGNSLNPTNKIYRHTIIPPPDPWFADFNQDDAPNTLRIFRLDGNQHIDTCEYSFNPQIGDWNPPKLKIKTSADGTDSANNNPWLRRLILNLISFLTSLIFKPLTLLAPLLRLLLWPIADFKWQEKIKNRETQLRLEFVEKLNMNPDGYHHTFDGIQLREDGTARFQDKVFKPGKPQLIQTSPLRGEDVVWAEWNNNQLTIHSGARVYSYEFGGWHQKRIHEPSFRDSLVADFSATKASGYNFVVNCFVISFVLFILFVIYALIVQARDWN